MRKHVRSNKKTQQRNFWQSYSDMMAALLLVFILALVGGMLSATKRIDQRESELESQKEALREIANEKLELESTVSDQNDQLSEYEKLQLEYENLVDLLAKEKGKNTRNEKKIKELEDDLATVRALLAAANANVDTLTDDLAEANANVDTLTDDLAAANTNIDTLTDDLAAANTNIDTLTDDLAAANTNIDTLTDDLAAANANVDTLSDELVTANASIDALTTDNETLNGQVVDWQAKYNSAAGELNTTQEALSEKTNEVNGMKEDLEKIIGVRESLIKELSEEFQDTDLTVDKETGAISFKSTLLFDKNKSNLKEPGKEFLENFFPRYVDLLLDDAFIDKVAQIIIEGHADTDGDYITNLQLSQDRAYAVAAYFLGETGPGAELFDTERREKLRKIVTANGRSSSVPIYDENGEVDMDASRRVEIQFRLKDEDMIQQMVDALG